ncbi:MAG: LysE family transporter [Bacillota bacterium]|jgi:threonine/homoserine/homoserine lactone efflux protein
MIATFLTSLALGFSGAMMPGPLLTYTIKQALNTGPLSGFIIILGHVFLEVILIALIFLGFDIILQLDIAQIIIGIIGGILLIYMGTDMIISSVKNKIKIELEEHNSSGTKNMLLSGMVISGINPYFLIWWAIIGLGFLLEAYKSFGPFGVLVFYVGHASADFIWYGLVSTIVGTTRKFIKENLYRIIIVVLGGILVFFGGSFIYKAALMLA